jgi:hypothetical protein
MTRSENKNIEGVIMTGPFGAKNKLVEEAKAKAKAKGGSNPVAAESEPERPIMEYNNKTYQSWMKLEDHIPNIEDKIPHGVTLPEQMKKEFLSLVDLEQGPIERSVMTMVRFKAKNRGDKEAKEYLTYREVWSAKAWTGRN